MKRISLLIFPALLAVTLAAGSIFAKNPRPSTSDRLKAGYIYNEGIAARVEGDLSGSFYLLQQAAALDPEDVDIAAALGEYYVIAGLGDSADFERSYSAIRRLFTSNPKDYRSGQRFAKVAADAFRFTDLIDTYRLLSATYPERMDYALEYAWQLGYLGAGGDSAAIDTAMAIYDRLESGTGITPELASHRLRWLSLLEDTASMVVELGRLYQSAPTDPNTALMVGNVYEYIDRPDSALAYYNLACELDSTNGEAFLERANFFLTQGDSARYDEEVYKVLESPSLEFEPKLQILTDYTRALYTDSAHIDRISEMFGSMVDIHPGEPKLHWLYGAFLAAVDSAAGASEQFGYAVDLDPDVDEYWRLRVQTAIMAGDTVTALAVGREAVHRFPDNMYYALVNSSMSWRLESPEAALADLDAFDTSDFENDEALSAFHQQRGDILHAMHLNDSAMVEYNLAIQLDPTNVGAMNNAAYFMACDGVNLDQAERFIVEAIHERPNDPTFIDTYAWVLFKQKKYSEARLQIDLALSLYHADTDNTDEENSAEIVVTEEDRDNEPSSEIFDHAGDIYFMNGEPAQALEFWKKALELEPDNASIRKKVTHKTYFFE